MKSSPEKEVASKKTPERPSKGTSEKKTLPKDVSKEKTLSEKKEPKRKVIVFTKKRKI